MFQTTNQIIMIPNISKNNDTIPPILGRYFTDSAQPHPRRNHTEKALLQGKGPMVPRYRHLRFILPRQIKGHPRGMELVHCSFGCMISWYLYISFSHNIYMMYIYIYIYENVISYQYNNTYIYMYIYIYDIMSYHIIYIYNVVRRLVWGSTIVPNFPKIILAKWNCWGGPLLCIYFFLMIMFSDFFC